MKKLYLIYHYDDSSTPYAVSDNKAMAEYFIMQRNGKFNMKSINVSLRVYDNWYDTYSDNVLELHEFVNCRMENVIVIMTRNECETIDIDYRFLIIDFCKINDISIPSLTTALKPKWVKFVDDLNFYLVDMLDPDVAMELETLNIPYEAVIRYLQGENKICM
jgi:hypothetical protein